MKRNAKIICWLATITVGFLIFYVFLKKTIVPFRCRMIIETKINNFRQSTSKSGMYRNPQEEAYIDTLIPRLRQQCERNEE